MQNSERILTVVHHSSLDQDHPLVLFLSGPNLSQLGIRQPEIYGRLTLNDHIEIAKERAKEFGIDIAEKHYEDEGALVEAIHHARVAVAAIVINAGALTHYSWALADALKAFPGPVVELHITNPAAREPWRHKSVIAGVADGVIAGFGVFGYSLAVDAVVHLLEEVGK